MEELCVTQRMEKRDITRITDFPWECHVSASSAVNTTWPTAAPGDAGKPVAMTWSLYADGFSNWFFHKTRTTTTTTTTTNKKKGINACQLLNS
jgi:hypothetical protein